MGAGPNSDVPGSVNLTAAAAKRLVVQVLTAYGAPGDNAEVVAGHLVDCDLAGVPSHGLIRVPQYVDEILSGEIDPEAKPSVHHVSSARRDIVGHRCFGQVGCARAVGEASALAADHGLGLVTVRETGHAGRIGAYAESLGRMGLLSMVFCSGPRSGHRVSPFNGREGRLATNPIAFSVPTSGEPIVGDFSARRLQKVASVTCATWARTPPRTLCWTPRAVRARPERSVHDTSRHHHGLGQYEARSPRVRPGSFGRGDGDRVRW